jgi:hypothetical protein
MPQCTWQRFDNVSPAWKVVTVALAVIEAVVPAGPSQLQWHALVQLVPARRRHIAGTPRCSCADLLPRWLTCCQCHTRQTRTTPCPPLSRSIWVGTRSGCPGQSQARLARNPREPLSVRRSRAACWQCERGRLLLRKAAVAAGCSPPE